MCKKNPWKKIAMLMPPAERRANGASAAAFSLAIDGSFLPKQDNQQDQPHLTYLNLLTEQELENSFLAASILLEIKSHPDSR